VKTILSLEIILYVGVLAFLGFNFWRIMVKLRKIALIPLTIFYISASVICCARIASCFCYTMYYSEQDGNDE